MEIVFFNRSCFNRSNEKFVHFLRALGHTWEAAVAAATAAWSATKDMSSRGMEYGRTHAEYLRRRVSDIRANVKQGSGKAEEKKYKEPL